MTCYRKSLQVGQVAEEYVSKVLRNAGLPAVPNKAREKKSLAQWDIASELDGRPFHLEVKFDLMEKRTGNVAVEYFNTRACETSGIAVTTAELWVYVFQPLQAWVGRVSDLKLFCKHVKPLRDVTGGDDNAAMWLYARDVILPVVFRPMDDLTPDELRSLLAELTTE